MASMKIPPRKPHFFKPILPGFKDGVNIPIGFLKYLKGHEHIEHAVLKRAGKRWLVKVNGRRLEEGWEKFADVHDLELGDMLIFRHEGDMEFEVTIFDSSHCSREYAEYLQQEEEEVEEDVEEQEEVHDDEEEEAAGHTVEETSKDLEFKEKPSPSIQSSDKASSHSEAAARKPFGHSCFVCTINPSCFTYGRLHVPKRFAFANGLITNKKYDLCIRDEKQRSWSLKLHSSETQTFIRDGWRKFIADNCLKEGNRIIFEIVTNGETPAWKFHVVTDAETPMRKFRENATKKPKPNVMSSHENFPDVEAAKDMPLGRPHFISTIKPSCLSKYLMSVPKQFALDNGLSDRRCTVTIKDEQRSWVFSLYTTASTTFIGGGWPKFCAANFLKAGDHVMFELFSKGKEPIFKFYDLRANASLHPEEKKHNLDSERVSTQGLGIETSDMPPPTSANANPHFISTIKPCAISRSFLCLPIAFAKSNGLMDRREMILRDEKQRSWTVQLRQRAKRFAITGGLQQYMIANGVQVGDTYKFELIDNGTIPVVYFHCKYRGKDAKPERNS